jgi:hypothetical protein
VKITFSGGKRRKEYEQRGSYQRGSKGSLHKEEAQARWNVFSIPSQNTEKKGRLHCRLSGIKVSKKPGQENPQTIAEIR